MDRDFVSAQAVQDQQWMELDDWYARKVDKEELSDIVALLDEEPTKENLKKIAKLPPHGLEIIRCLALHTLRELALRNERAKEDSLKEESES